MALNYLASKHNINKNTGEIKQPPLKDPNQLIIKAFPDTYTLNYQQAFNGFKALLIRWLVYYHITFFQFKNIYFRQLLYYIYLKLASLLPKAGNTIQKWVIYAFNQWKKNTIYNIKTAWSLILISFNLWTSPNAYTILRVVAHYINRFGRRRYNIIGL